MKKNGSREEVFKGLAEKTNGGLKKEDLKEKIVGKKVKYVSRKKSMRMQKNNPFQNKSKSKSKIINIINNDKSKSKSKIKIKTEKKKKKKTRKISFNLDNNKVKEYYCKEMDDVNDIFDTTNFNNDTNNDIDFIKLHSKNKKNDFKIEDIGDINLNYLD